MCLMNCNYCLNYIIKWLVSFKGLKFHVSHIQKFCVVFILWGHVMSNKLYRSGRG